MSNTGLFSNLSLLNELQRIWQGRLSGELSFPFESGIIVLSFAKGTLVALDGPPAKKYLREFLESHGSSLELPGVVLSDRLEMSKLLPLRNLIQDWIGQMTGNLSKPGISFLVNFKAQETGLEPCPWLAIPALAVPLFERWMDEASIRSITPSRESVMQIAPEAMSLIRDLPLTPRQGFMLTRLLDGMTVNEFASACNQPEDYVHRALLTFVFLGVAHLTSTPAGPAVNRAAGPPPARPVPIPAAPPPAARPPASAPPVSPASPVSRPASRSADSSRSTAGPVSAELLDEINDLSIIARKGDHYAILDVDPHAETEEIKKRFVEMTRKFHPDKFQQYNDPGLQAKIDGIYARIAEAYETLHDPRRRTEYNERSSTGKVPAPAENNPKPGTGKPAAGKPVDAPAAEAPKPPSYEDPKHRARQHFLHGKDAAKNRKFHDAVEHFRESVRLEPETAEYQYWLGKTLSMNPQRMKEAEERLQAAIKLAPSRPEMLLELGRLYEKLNMKLRAEKIFRQVLQMDPKNKEARMVLGIKDKKPFEFKNLLKIDLADLLKPKKDE